MIPSDFYDRMTLKLQACDEFCLDPLLSEKIQNGMGFPWFAPIGLSNTNELPTCVAPGASTPEYG